MPRRTVLVSGIIVASLVAAISLSVSLTVAQTNSNTNTYSNSNTNTSLTLAYVAGNGQTVKVGDANGDGVVGGPGTADAKREALEDIQAGLSSLYCLRCPAGKQNPTLVLGCQKAANVDGNTVVDVNDAIYYIRFAFGGGPAPQKSPSTAPLTCNQLAPVPAPSPSPSPSP